MVDLNRRRFVQSVAGAGGVQLAAGSLGEMQAQTPERSHPRISEVEFVRIRGSVRF
jgi:phosphodiesterase/alkaline phosphatase D-like protein